MGNYCYKIDKNTDAPTDVIIDAHNHGIDALRYAVGNRIKRKHETAEKWARMI